MIFSNACPFVIYSCNMQGHIMMYEDWESIQNPPTQVEETNIKWIKW